MTVCRYSGCDRTDKLVRGYCDRHYRQLLRGTLDPEPEQVMGLPLTHENVPLIALRAGEFIRAQRAAQARKRD